MNIKLLLQTILVTIGTGLNLIAVADCPRYIAPNNFENPKKPWGQTDTGVIVNGFVDLRASRDALYLVNHGADLSKHNVVSHRELKDCGANFTFVRMDNFFSPHVKKLISEGVTSIPYYFFPVGRKQQETSRLGIGSDEKISVNMAKFEEIGREAGEAFVTKARELIPDGLPMVNLSGLKGQLIALDVEEKLINESKTDPLQRAYFGRYYAHSICTWMQEVKKTYTEAKIIIYTTPSVYADYLDKAFPKDHACLQGLPIWVARTTLDGGDVIRSSNDTIDKFAQRLCLVSGGNRCVVHQYSHRATFAATNSGVGKTPPHIDINRLFDTKEVKTDVGFQNVRSLAKR